jgi:hypothetical protein
LASAFPGPDWNVTYNERYNARPRRKPNDSRCSPGSGPCFLADQPRWSAFWDKRFGVWRVAEDDPDSDLYAECSDADAVIAYITAHA